MSTHLETSMSNLNPIGQVAMGISSSFFINAGIHPISTIKNRIMANCAQATHVAHTTERRRQETQKSRKVFFINPAVYNSFSRDENRVSSRRMVIRGVVASAAKNSVRLVATVRNTMKEYYGGFGAICSVDALSFGLAYMSNDSLQSQLSPIAASIASGVISSPGLAFGEGVMATRQVTNLPYSKTLARAMRPSGFLLTITREIPFTWSVFWLSPLIQNLAQNQIPEHQRSAAVSVALQVLAGSSSGAIVGVMTTPIDMLKTRVQTSENPSSILNTARAAWAEGGWRTFFRGGKMRSLYIALNVAGMNVLNNTIPQFLPSICLK